MEHPRDGLTTSTRARLGLFSVVCAALIAVAALAPGASAHQARTASGAPHGIYDCYYNAGGLYYLDSYQFSTPGIYKLGFRLHGSKLNGKVDTGRYHMRGKRIIPSSGPLKKQHYYMVVGKHGAEVATINDGGKPTGVGCYRYHHK